MKMPIYHTTTMPSIKLTSYLSELSMIAAFAKAANQLTLYNQAKEAHDRLVSQYNEQTRPKKKGFWEQFKDNITFRDLDTHVAIPLTYLEDDPTFKAICEGIQSWPPNRIQSELNQAVADFNRKHR